MAKQIVLAGFHAVNARVRLQPSSIKVVYVDRDRRDKRMQECRVRLEKAQVKVVFADAARLNGLAPDLPHQGIVALADEIKNSLTFDELLDNITDKTLLLILDGVTDPRNFGACLRVADAAGVQAVIAPKDRSASFSPAAAAGETEKSIYDFDQKRAFAWVLGAEGEGLRQLTRKRCDDLAKIPMMGTVESLNVSVAAGICLFETARQRRAG